ncbi:MAG: alpha-crystallin domain-containing protein [Methanoculleaceae archaeon]
MSNKNPYDEFVQNFTKILEDLIKQLPVDRTPNFVGCTIITGPGSHTSPPGENTGKNADEDYEIIETNDRIFISLELEPDIPGPPEIHFHEGGVTITIGDEEDDIDLDCAIDTASSFYTIQNGVLDIICYKR